MSDEREKQVAHQAQLDQRKRRLKRFLREDVWPKISAYERGRRLSREEEDEILGYGPKGL